MRDVSPSLAGFLSHPGMTVECIYVHFYKIDPASDGLVAYWKFDDNTKGKIVKDYTGNGFDLKTEREVNWQSVALPEE